MSNADNDLLLQPVTELSRRIAAKELSPVELAEATLRQVARLEPTLNAYAEPFDEFMASAKAAEKEIAAGRSRGPGRRGAPGRGGRQEWPRRRAQR